MIVPVRLALAVALLLGAAARAEAAPSRTKRDRPVTVTVNPAEPLPEIHVAPDVPTLLLFPADIQNGSMSRSGKTPQQVLDGTLGALVVDAYTGYNPVTLPGGRVRVGCWAHVRRKFFAALPTAPEAQQALDFIPSLYRVEHEAVQTVLLNEGAQGQPTCYVQPAQLRMLRN
ncbi:MAG: DUF2381 family protein [Myxococcaceae bacterium]|nr:DUF2381 family protein [Myxococcaceae bacterium]